MLPPKPDTHYLYKDKRIKIKHRAALCGRPKAHCIHSAFLDAEDETTLASEAAFDAAKTTGRGLGNKNHFYVYCKYIDHIEKRLLVLGRYGDKFMHRSVDFYQFGVYNKAVYLSPNRFLIVCCNTESQRCGAKGCLRGKTVRGGLGAGYG